MLLACLLQPADQHIVVIDVSQAVNSVPRVSMNQVSVPSVVDFGFVFSLRAINMKGPYQTTDKS